MNRQSAVSFPTPTRAHLALEVSDISTSIRFYEALLGQSPVKVRPGYAKFETVDPPLNLALNQTQRQRVPAGGAAHFGIQVKSTGEVAAWRRQVETAGLTTDIEDDVICCYALQDKFWATDPDGHRWEVFVVVDADAEDYHTKPAATGCCPAPAAEASDATQASAATGCCPAPAAKDTAQASAATGCCPAPAAKDTAQASAAANMGEQAASTAVSACCK